MHGTGPGPERKADLLNMALFGFTAKEWRDSKTDLDLEIHLYVLRTIFSPEMVCE